MTVSELAERIGATVAGDGSVAVDSAATLEQARPGQVSFLTSARYAKLLETTRASAVIVGLDTTSPGVTLLRVADPYFALAQAVEVLHGRRRHPFAGVHPQAAVDPSAKIGPDTVVYPGAVIGADAVIGRECIIYPNVTIYDNCVIGDRVIIHAGAVIGADGFGFATRRGVHHKIHQVGNVVIEDDVEIGANSCIDRAALGSTVIGRGTKIDDLVMVAHNVRVGPNSLLVAQCGVAGSTAIGRNATIAGQAGIAGHLNLGDAVTVAAQSGVTSNIPDQTTVMGSPAMPVSHARRVYTLFTQLPQLLERVRQLEQQVQELSAGEGGVLP